MKRKLTYSLAGWKIIKDKSTMKVLIISFNQRYLNMVIHKPQSLKKRRKWLWNLAKSFVDCFWGLTLHKTWKNTSGGYVCSLTCWVDLRMLQHFWKSHFQEHFMEENALGPPYRKLPLAVHISNGSLPQIPVSAPDVPTNYPLCRFIVSHSRTTCMTESSTLALLFECPCLDLVKDWAKPI